MWTRYRLRLGATVALNSVQIPANANSGRSSLRANQTTSFFLVSGFGSGAYSAKLFTGTRQRFSGLSQPRQCGDDVLRMLVTGGLPVRGGGGMPSASWSAHVRHRCCAPRAPESQERRPASAAGCRRIGSALIVTNEFLENEVGKLMKAVSHA
jgi:hypothetical protein